GDVARVRHDVAAGRAALVVVDAHAPVRAVPVGGLGAVADLGAALDAETDRAGAAGIDAVDLGAVREDEVVRLVEEADVEPHAVRAAVDDGPGEGRVASRRARLGLEELLDAEADVVAPRGLDGRRPLRYAVEPH